MTSFVNLASANKTQSQSVLLIVIDIELQKLIDQSLIINEIHKILSYN